MHALETSAAALQAPERSGSRAYLAALAVALVALGAALAYRRLMREDSGAPRSVAPVRIRRAPPAPDPLASPRSVIGRQRGHRRPLEVVTLNDMPVEIHTARAFLAMRRAAADSGVELGIASGFRTREEQAELYRAYRRGAGNKAAHPGRSNHESGRALDIALDSDGALAWLEANAARFHFRRTVRSEPWHWEYVNVPRARGKRIARRRRARARRARRIAGAKRARARRARRNARAKRARARRARRLARAKRARARRRTARRAERARRRRRVAER